MADVDLKFALDMPPEKAIAYFEQKGYKFSWDWTDTWQEAHHKAFAVAKVMRADILQDIRNEVDKAIRNGKGYEEFEKNLMPMLKAKGWWGKQWIIDEAGTGKEVQLGSPHRLRLIYDTNMQIAFSQGRYQTQLDAAPLKPYWKYVTKDDTAVRLSHRLLHGKVFRFDDPFWDHFYPPNGFRCRCRVETLSQRQLDNNNLKVQSSEGKLETIEKKIGNKDYKTTVFKGQRKVSPDPGWDYNPAKAPMKPDFTKYDEDILDELKKALKENPEIPGFKTPDIKTAEDYAREHIAKKVNYKGFDPDIANQINTHIEKRLNELSYLPDKLKSLKSENIKAAMSISNNADLSIKTSLIKKDTFKTVYNEVIANTEYVHRWVYFKEEEALTSTLDHELGHLVQNKLFGPFEKSLKNMNAWSEALESSVNIGWLYPTFYAARGNEKYLNNPEKLKISQLREAFSECYSLYVNNKLYLLSTDIINYFNKLNLWKR